MSTSTIVRWLPSLSMLLVAVSTVPPARAEEDASVEAAIQDGIALRRSGNDEAALSIFLDLERKNPTSARVLLHATAAAQATGRWLLAYDYLLKAAAFKNDPYYVRNRAAVKAVEEAVAQHVGQLRVVGEPPGADVRLNGKLVGRLPLENPVSVEVGAYALEVSKVGYYPLRRDITISGGGVLSRELVELASSQSPADRAALRSSDFTPRRAPARATDRGRSWWEASSVTWTLAGTALAGAGTAAVALAVREQQIQHWNDDALCIDRQNVTRRREDVCGDQRDAANTAGAVAITGGVVAGIFATAALTHWLTTSSQAKLDTEQARRTACGIGVGSIVCSGTF